MPKFLQKDRTSGVLKSRGSSEYFGVTDRESSMAIALKFILENGEQKAIHYHDIVSPMFFDGNSTIKLSTTSLSVLIQGNALSDLFDYIIQHRVKWVKELDQSFQSKSEEELIITELRFEEM